MTFVNTASAIKVSQAEREKGAYAYDEASPYLRVWSRLFQKVVSQSGTYLLTRQFHTRGAAIHVAEGGVLIADVGELVLHRAYCTWASYTGKLEQRAHPLYRLSGLITAIVLGWHPQDPIETLLRAAAVNVNVEVKRLREAVERETQNLFGGDSLWSFWGDRRSEAPDQEYWRWCMLHVERKPVAEVDQFFEDRRLGFLLKEQLEAKLRATGRHCYVYACSPQREDGVLKFWVNTSRETEIAGWQTHDQLQQFLAKEAP